MTLLLTSDNHTLPVPTHTLFTQYIYCVVLDLTPCVYPMGSEHVLLALSTTPYNQTHQVWFGDKPSYCSLVRIHNYSCIINYMYMNLMCNLLHNIQTISCRDHDNRRVTFTAVTRDTRCPMDKRSPPCWNNIYNINNNNNNR